MSTADDFCKLPRAEPSHRQRFGIALLCRGADAACLHSFVRYHRFIGVEAIYLYLDDPLEAPSLRLDKLKSELSGLDFSLDVTLCTREYWKQRLTSSTMIARRFEHKVFDDAARCWRDEAQSRQSLCIEEAIEKASYDGLDWLLHIDIDECLLPQRTHPSDFFGLLPSEVEQVFFSNFEGVPPSSDLVDWFAECDEFKVNPSCCQEEGACGEGGPPRSNQREVEELWRAHQARSSEQQQEASGSLRRRTLPRMLAVRALSASHAGEAAVVRRTFLCPLMSTSSYYRMGLACGVRRVRSRAREPRPQRWPCRAPLSKHGVYTLEAQVRDPWDIRQRVVGPRAMPYTSPSPIARRAPRRGG